MMRLREIETLLYDETPETLEYVARRARELRRQRFGNVIQMYAPLYISNECVDTCRYCAFSLPNDIVRKTLTPQQVADEADHLLSQGFRHLLLVAGEHPKAVSPATLKEITQRLRPRLASLNIEVAPFDEATYRDLSRAGVDGVILYQETYDRERYEAVHLAGPKSNYQQRIAAPERALRGGVRRMGMGILLGLADWRKDALQLIEHVRVLQRRYWQVDFQVSVPRLRPCYGGLSDPVEIADRDFVKLICVLRMALPEVGLVLSTRESPRLRDGLIPLGVTHMSAGSRTEPGGYGKPMAAAEQFSIEDSRPAQAVAEAIIKKQLEPVWKDWESSLHG